MQDCDLSKVFVPMKISVIKDEQDYSEIVKEISTSANSQTAIKRSDFLSGDEFLKGLENISRTETEPTTQTRWYFERKEDSTETRHQTYLVTKKQYLIVHILKHKYWGKQMLPNMLYSGI